MQLTHRNTHTRTHMEKISKLYIHTIIIIIYVYTDIYKWYADQAKRIHSSRVYGQFIYQIRPICMYSLHNDDYHTHSNRKTSRNSVCVLRSNVRMFEGTNIGHIYTYISVYH